MGYVRARMRTISGAVVAGGLLLFTALAPGGAAAADAVAPVATTTTLTMNADGTGTVRVTVADGSSPVNPVDLWVDSTWQQTFTVPGGSAKIDIGTQPLGDHRITVRYRNTTAYAASQASLMWTAPGTVQVPTTTALKLNADGTGTITVSADGATPTNPVDFWIDGTWQRAYTLTNGQAAVTLGTQPLGDHQVVARYRASSTSGASQAVVTWTAPGTVQAPTTTALKLNADGTGTITVTSLGAAPTNPVDFWIDSTWQRAYTLTNGQAAVNVGTQSVGDHRITARYRASTLTAASQVSLVWTAPGTVQVPTTTALKLNADGTGTVTVTASGATPVNPVDLWIDSTWQRAYTLTNGQAAVNLGTQALGDHRITVRYRASTLTAASQASVVWTAPGTVQVPTTTTLNLNADGTGTIKVTATGTTAVNLANPVDLWIDSTWQRAYTLTNGTATFDLGPQPGGDHRVTVRYRPSTTSGASQASLPWSVVTADQVPTTTTLDVRPDGTATIAVSVKDGQTAGNPVDLWVEGRPQSTYTLKDGRVTVALGSRAGGDLPVKVRYRPSATQLASTATAVWSVDTAPKPDGGACGATVAKADGSAWTCTFADDFDGSTLDRAKWSVQTNFATGDDTHQACYVDSPQNINVGDGALHLTVLKGDPQPCAGQGGAVMAYTAGMVTTSHTWSQQYGRFEARVKTTATTLPGLHEAFWLWPDDRYPEGQGTWPANGEIDIAETYSKFADLVVPYLHTALDTVNGILTGANTNTSWSCTGHRGEFNTYTLEWTPDRVEVFVNGKSCVVNTSGNDAFKKRYIMALTQGLGSQEGNTLVDDTPIPATMTVDYVHAWS
ncbi:hypothetical protein GCM10011584_05920 [Nocardioides phosphati]|uniref:GH16 domain-containing protein n=1 Tax=Nocardioides phosphati TaxID=1867775 RepID=A0ABQ2N7C5_9ACTN|nr:glycoside hydrolase family 16 protein [Nocardioides phosphati]GGO85594.1 hypothetical protein GCM10011584_05920 [Nocardioides phosphati]